MIDAETLAKATRYARSYWQFGQEPESQYALRVLSDALAASDAEMERLRHALEAMKQVRIQRDALQAQVDAVRDAVGWWQSEYVPTDSGWVEICVKEILAALGETGDDRGNE